MKIFPIIAKGIVFKKVSEHMYQDFLQVNKELAQGKLDGLASLHAITCCMKAVYTNEITEDIETCRIACGGHGYLVSAGFSDMYKVATACQTLEGENTVMLLQTARFLIKSWDQALQGEPLHPTVLYLKNYVNGNQRKKWNSSLEGILTAFETTTAGRLALALKHLQQKMKTYTVEEATNLTGNELAKVGELHCHVYLMQTAIASFNPAIKSASPALAKVLSDILELYFVHKAVKSIGLLLQFNDLTQKDIEGLEIWLEKCLVKLRSNAIGIVDGFDVPDVVLHSTLGAYDGNYEERLLEDAKKSPLNEEDKSIKIKMNADIKEERAKVSFNIDEFTNWYHGGFENVKKKRFMESYFLNDPELQDKIPLRYLSQKEFYEETIRKMCVVLKKLKKLQDEGAAGPELYSEVMGTFFQRFIAREQSPLALHFDMFIPALKKLGTEEQQAQWIPRAMRCGVIGAYAQTEIGHGTFLRGLQTTATYDPQTKEFVMHTPTTSAYKFWIGGLGQTANYALVFADLHTLGKSYGIHAFLVQVRDEVTHKPMKGISVGDIGVKIGFNCTNNGFLGMDNVRIPLKHMMMKNAEVLENGEYKKKNSGVLTYGTMTRIRAGLIIDLSHMTANAVTIAMRYSTVRRQCTMNSNSPEVKIIDHFTQQMKIFPAIAKVIVFKKVSEHVYENYIQVNDELDKGNLDGLASLHAISCCLKAVGTVELLEAVETCRIACGGHGYLISAGFSDPYKIVTACQTVEGDNTVMLLQTARFLIKSWGQALKGEPLHHTVLYLKNYVNGSQRQKWNSSLEGILTAFETTTAGRLALALKHLQQKMKTYTVEEAINLTGNELVKVAELHCHVFLLRTAVASFNPAIKSASPALSKVLSDILELYFVHLAVRSLGLLFQFNDLTPDDIEGLENRLEECLVKLRNNAIGIVDGFDIPDIVLQSTLGAYDGNYEERLLADAKKSPFNQEDVNKSFHLYIKPYRKSHL
ncbi:putative peroxisomal acyl-coenzyme A oxidase 1 [Pseudolycoriella hygida]|uniref:Peroxisomal acyl-coenzyme A oxidase 1 n=1 Tax=Pseudolycoriella hygida TaxID=35572 RepID=A0A9Q0S2T2_9DIPT|nr:putative peroxisomal acyl-coenzyme A oxidase 1 [Pseudolycoriella hygida]